MRLAKFMLASATAATFLMSAAAAQQATTGTVTQINRLNGMVTIQETQSGTVGAGGGGFLHAFVRRGAGLGGEGFHGNGKAFEAEDGVADFFAIFGEIDGGGGDEYA